MQDLFLNKMTKTRKEIGLTEENEGAIIFHYKSKCVCCEYGIRNLKERLV